MGASVRAACLTCNTRLRLEPAAYHVMLHVGKWHHKVCTFKDSAMQVLCDGGQRHLSKFHNPEYLQQHGLTPVHTSNDLTFVS